MKLPGLEHRVLPAMGRAMGEFSMLRHDKEGARREIREFLCRLAARHPDVPPSIEAALASVNPDLLFTPTFSGAGAAAEDG